MVGFELKGLGTRIGRGEREKGLMHGCSFVALSLGLDSVLLSQDMQLGVIFFEVRSRFSILDPDLIPRCFLVSMRA